MSHYIPMPASFYQQDTLVVAQQLLGCLIVRVLEDGTRLVGKIVETEAYHIYDPACHAFRGKTHANRALFGPVGHAYIYFIYGKHYCLNVVARISTCDAGGVLIRALQPLEGSDIMEKNRHKKGTDLTNGPGKLAQALHITPQLYGVDLTAVGPLYIAHGKKEKLRIISTPRIGISKAQDVHWRFYVANNPWVSNL